MMKMTVDAVVEITNNVSVVFVACCLFALFSCICKKVLSIVASVQGWLVLFLS